MEASYGMPMGQRVGEDSEIAGEERAVRNSIDGFREALKELEGRLSSVLSPVVPGPSSQLDPTKRKAALTPLGDALRTSSQKAQEATAELRSIICRLGLVLVFGVFVSGCSVRLAPESVSEVVARVQAESIDCRYCSSYGYRDCREHGGWTGRWRVTEYLDYSSPYELYQKGACEVQCNDGLIVGHACKSDPADWRMAEVR